MERGSWNEGAVQTPFPMILRVDADDQEIDVEAASHRVVDFEVILGVSRRV
jgi:hypothetical protein